MSFPRPTRRALALVLACASAMAQADTLSPNLEVNGFATAGVVGVSEDFGGKYLGDPFRAEIGINNDGNFRHDNVLGVQLAYRVDEQIDLVGQLISVGKEDYDTRAEWAYLAYRVNDSLRLRAGRIALPFYMYSESIRVGQAYPWARLPVEVYAGMPFYNTDGVDLLYRLPLGAWNLDAQAYQGRSTQATLAYTAETTNMHGVNVTLSRDAFAVRASYNASGVSVSYAPAVPLIPVNDIDGSFAGLAMTYDDGNWFIAAEATQLRLGSYLPDTDAAYVSVGHYFGKWLPYVLAGKSNSVRGDECRDAFLPTLAALGPLAPSYADATCRGQEPEQTSYSVGFRYDLSKRASLKLEVDHVTGFHGTPGRFTLPTTVGPAGPAVPLPGALTDDDSVEVITLNLNAAF